MSRSCSGEEASSISWATIELVRFFVGLLYIEVIMMMTEGGTRCRSFRVKRSVAFELVAQGHSPQSPDCDGGVHMGPSPRYLVQ